MVTHRERAPSLFLPMDEVFELPNVRHDDDTGYTLYGSFTHRWAPQFDFYGLGPGSREEDHADFRLKDTLVEGLAGYRLLSRVTVSARAGYYQASTGPGTDEKLPQVEDVFAPSAIPGFGARPDFLRYGAAAVLDARDVARNPHRGGLLAAEWLRYDQRGGSGSGFDRFAADARIYLPLGHPQRVLALRTYLSTDEPRGDGGRVPFYMQAFLGSSHTLRAYSSQRFRGEKLLLFQGEYRIEASPRGVRALAETGLWAHADEGLALLTTPGGLRLKTPRSLLCAAILRGLRGFRLLLPSSRASEEYPAICPYIDCRRPRAPPRRSGFGQRSCPTPRAAGPATFTSRSRRASSSGARRGRSSSARSGPLKVPPRK